MDNELLEDETQGNIYILMSQYYRFISSLIINRNVSFKYTKTNYLYIVQLILFFLQLL